MRDTALPWFPTIRRTLPFKTPDRQATVRHNRVEIINESEQHSTVQQQQTEVRRFSGKDSPLSGDFKNIGGPLIQTLSGSLSCD